MMREDRVPDKGWSAIIFDEPIRSRHAIVPQ
jgi:hypothetical protein